MSLPPLFLVAIYLTIGTVVVIILEYNDRHPNLKAYVTRRNRIQERLARRDAIRQTIHEGRQDKRLQALDLCIEVMRAKGYHFDTVTDDDFKERKKFSVVSVM